MKISVRQERKFHIHIWGANDFGFAWLFFCLFCHCIGWNEMKLYSFDWKCQPITRHTHTLTIRWCKWNERMYFETALPWHNFVTLDNCLSQMYNVHSFCECGIVYSVHTTHAYWIYGIYMIVHFVCSNVGLAMVFINL